MFYPRCSPLIHQGSTTGFGGPWNKAVRGSLIAEHGLQFNPDLMGVYDDRMFALNAYVRASRITYVQRPVYNYVLVENSITQAYKPHILDVNAHIFRVFSAYVHEHYEGDEAIEQAYHALVVNRLSDVFSEYLFNAKNPDAWSVKKKLIADLLKSEPYRSALTRVRTSPLSKMHRLITLVARHHSAEGIRGLYRLRASLKRLRRR